MSSSSSKNVGMGNYSQNHLSLAHIPGKLNTVADKESRSNRVDTEWMLQSKVLNLALEHLCFKPEIDLFAINIKGKYRVWIHPETRT